MANEEHVGILKQGVEAWNCWRQQRPDVAPELIRADLNGAYLNGASLSWADLNGADLTRADLNGADLTRADLTRADLNGATLSRAKLTEADLSGANLNRADLNGADLNAADLTGADLNGANLTRANLCGADFSAAHLSGTNLTRANLTWADLSWANLGAADLTGANLKNCVVGYTVFADVDLSQVRRLDTVRHEGPSSIGIDTVWRSRGNIPGIFLRRAGVPERFIEQMHALVRQAIEYYSCFISYSHHDKRVCERLHADLQAHGVRAWYFPEDAVMGRPVWGQIDRGIRIYDKLVVVCSENSLQSGPVLREIERALQREDREGTHVLFPIRIDDYIFDHWQHERKADVIAKVVGDFTGWHKDAAKYEASFRKLMKALQPETDADEVPGAQVGKKAL